MPGYNSSHVCIFFISRATTTYPSLSCNLKQNPCEMSTFSLKSQVAGPMRKYKDEFVACVKDSDLDLDYLIQKAKKIQHVELSELLGKVKELHLRLSKVPQTALKEYEDEFMAHLHQTDLEGLANEVYRFRFLNVDELLSEITDISMSGEYLRREKLAACMKAINFDLDALIAKAKKAQQRELQELLEKIKELSNAYQKMSTKEPLKDENLKGYEDQFFKYLQFEYSNSLARTVKQHRHVDVDKFLKIMANAEHTESDEVVIKILDGLAVCLKAFDFDLAFYVKKAKIAKPSELKELSKEIMKLVNVHQEFCMQTPCEDQDQREYDDRFIACLHDLTYLAREGRGFRLVDVDTLLLNLAAAKHTFEKDCKNIFHSAMKALKYYERQFIACLQEASVNVLQTLVQDTYGARLIPEKVKNILISVHCDVPCQLRCRYLILYVYKGIEKGFYDSFDIWLNLLSRFEGINSVLSYVKMYYRKETGDSCTNSEGYSKEESLTPDFSFEENHVRILTNTLADCSSYWEKIAISLGLLDNDIRNIRFMMPNDPLLCLYRVINSWVMQKHGDTMLPTLKYLENALRSTMVGLGAKANDLREHLLKHGILQPRVQPRDGSPMQTEDELILKTLDQSQDTTIPEGEMYVLFGVTKTSSRALTYQWSKDGEKLKFDDDDKQSHRYHGSEEYIISILCDSLTVEGSYTCEIKLGNDVIVTEPVVLTIKTPLDQYRENLNALYTEQPEVPEDTWPPVSIDTYINLALIKQQGIDNAGEYARCTIRGDADDVFNDKESIEYESVFDRLGSGARLLIEGRPGSGKTTLIHKVSKDWAKGKLKYHQVRLLFLVHLRGFFSDPNIKLRNILECCYRSETSSAIKDIMKYAEKHNGLGLCFILDGLDEYLPKKKDTFIHNLINRSELPKAVVIVASRPVAVADFRSSATRQIEVLGFLKEQISEYVKEYNFSDESKSSELLKYLDHHPNVHHMCYLPIHTAMVCFLCQTGRSLPETEAGIYKEFTIYFFLRALRLYDDEDIYIDSLKSLPSSERESYMKICKLAFEMTLLSKQVMRHVEVRNFFDVRSNRDYLGLITVDKVALKYGFQKLYTFLHLTFQEFLAACHISNLEEKEQTKLIREYGNAKQMQIVWKFYCGLVKFNDNSKFQDLLEETQYGTLYNIQCSFESQQPSTCNSVIKDNSLSFKNIFFTPSDFTAIAFVISHAEQGISNLKLIFDECTFGQEEVNVLIKKAKDQLSQVTTLCFHGHNCAAEQLKVVSILMHALSSLKILDITDTQLGEDAVRALTSDLNHSNLQILKIDTAPSYSSNELLIYLVKSFTSKCSNFFNVWFPDNSKKHLLSSFSLPFYLCSNIHLPDINMSCRNLQPLEIDLISDELKVRLICSRLSLINCGITDERVKTLSGAIRCSNIKILELSMNFIGNEGALALANSIESCLTLHTIDLSCNRIGDDGALAIVRAIPVKTCDLFLWNNDISVHGAEVLLQAKQDIDLNSFYIDSRNIGDNGAADISKNVREDYSLHVLKHHYGCLHSLKLCSTSIGSDGAKALANALKTCTGLISLDLSSNMIGWIGAKALGDALSVCTSLTSLNLSGNSIDNSGAVAIANGLKKLSDTLKVHTSLTSLNLSGNSIGDDGATALAGVLKKLKLTTLNLSSNKINTSGAEALAAALSTMLHKKKYSNFHTLSLGHNFIGQRGARVLADALKKCTSLCTIDISDNGIDDEGAMALACVLKHSRNLHTLDIAQNHLKKDGILALAKAIKGCNKLYKLNIADNNNIDDCGIQAITNALKKTSNLRMLDISYSRMSKSSVQVLANSFKCWVKLQVLDVSHTNIGKDGIKTLAGAIKCCSNLHTLNVAHLCNDGSIKVLADAIKGCSELHALNISSNGIKAQDMKPLADAIQQCSKMHTLDISDNNLHRNGAETFCLHCNGAETLCIALKDCSNLHILDISCNNIGNDGAKALAGVIECRSNLHSLDITCNGIDEDGIKAIDDVIKYYSNFHLVSTACLREISTLWSLKPLPTGP